MFRLIALCLTLCLSAGPVLALPDRDNVDFTWRHGLIWRDSPLPATFRLVAQAPEAFDYYLELADPETGQDVMGAGIHGGRAFQVLVPPGTYEVNIAYWPKNLEGQTFGPETQTLQTGTPLTFEITGAGRKQGHILTLTQHGNEIRAAFAPADTCQSREVTRLAQIAEPETAPRLIPMPDDLAEPKVIPDVPAPVAPEYAVRTRSFPCE